MCDEYRRLFAAYQKATAEHARAVTALAEHTPLTHQSLWLRCEKARLASKDARDKVDAHVVEHGCVDGTSAAAQANRR